MLEQKVVEFLYENKKRSALRIREGMRRDIDKGFVELGQTMSGFSNQFEEMNCVIREIKMLEEILEIKHPDYFTVRL